MLRTRRSEILFLAEEVLYTNIIVSTWPHLTDVNRVSSGVARLISMNIYNKCHQQFPLMYAPAPATDAG